MGVVTSNSAMRGRKSTLVILMHSSIISLAAFPTEFMVRAENIDLLAMCPEKKGNSMKYSGVGGQAVLEGVMMRNQADYAVAVRKASGEIIIRKEKVPERSAFGQTCRKIPFVRGVFSFVDSLSMGMKTLEYSASSNQVRF